MQSNHWQRLQLYAQMTSKVRRIFDVTTAGARVSEAPSLSLA
jgi:hypothetical protein